MQKGDTPDHLKAIEAKMDALRSELLKYAEEQAQDTSHGHNPLHLPLMHSIMAIQETMRTFVSIATARND